MVGELTDGHSPSNTAAVLPAAAALTAASAVAAPPPQRRHQAAAVAAATNCARSRRPLPPLPSCCRCPVHRRCAIHCHCHCLRCRHRRRRHRHHCCHHRCCRCHCVAVVPSVTVASPSHCPSLSSPSAVVPSGRSGLAHPAAALALPLPQSLCRAALITAALPPPPPRCRHLRRANPLPPCCPLLSPLPSYPHHPAAVLPLQPRCHHHRHAAAAATPPLLVAFSVH
jgi:hypothetical protein